MSELSTTNLFESQTIIADHKDLIHDVAYDFYGERMATCSSDQYVKVNRLCLYVITANQCFVRVYDNLRYTARRFNIFIVV